MKKNFLLLLVAMIAVTFAVKAQYTVTLKVVDLTNGERTNPKTDADNIDANIYTWVSDGLSELNPRNPGDWWYPMYAINSVTPHGEMVQGDGILEWTLTLNVAPGIYEWSPGAKSLGWKNISPALVKYPFNGNPSFEVAEDGTITGVTVIEIGGEEPEALGGSMTLVVDLAPAGTQKIYVRGLYGDWNTPIEMVYDADLNVWTYEIDGERIFEATKTQEYKYWYTDNSWDTEEAIDAEGTKRLENRTLVFEDGDIQYDEVLFWIGDPSGVKTTALDKKFNISVSENNIVVTGIYNSVKVYSFSGQATGTTNLATGVYVVNVDGFSQKLIVK